MQIIKLNATESTNAYLKKLALVEEMEDFAVVVAQKQWMGRGQMGTKWEAEPGKNLTFSVLKKKLGLSAKNQFWLNMGVSLAVIDALNQLNVPDLSIKWPNDILSGHFKIGGILIENILSGAMIQSSIIGIGINVNQLEFGDLPRASSLKLLLGRSFVLDELLHSIMGHLRTNLALVSQSKGNILLSSYENVMFRRNKPSTFRDARGQLIMGFIKGVSADGKLLVLLEDDVLKEYDLKELQLLY
ncbi:biotin--[acetyl-CoA-carboxylase] ligase [Flavobacteriaceae bacterium F89]|uniref:Biotin--[acetyl-CoA-carboxylase] ligase n=1 Tax=Cerina litoralis TaxID=2874477 RepID=A0AAE3EW35_9FLAO|nr:biotin--[acetyl-CoA-carboxylase] ligase [Cerina litoralis]MCG2462132.1 biotin--[acetyl-CoA-carboxylase] ligase [Cerina litoralis]